MTSFEFSEFTFDEEEEKRRMIGAYPRRLWKLEKYLSRL